MYAEEKGDAGAIRAGNIRGVEVRAYVLLDEQGETLGGPVMISCQNGTWGSEQLTVVDSPTSWSVANHSSLEWGVSLDDAGLTHADSVRATFHATDWPPGPNDVMVVAGTQAGVAIPSLGQWGMILLTLLLVGLAYPYLRRHTGTAASLFMTAAGATLLLGGVSTMDTRAQAVIQEDFPPGDC
ncbi:MAG: IPTL-CTERM sorting domain-containing protein [Arhodomonas sp.]|nr:IPTL-CTERM sorting domain-containing protein [Arhodomonas sp.]